MSHSNSTNVREAQPNVRHRLLRRGFSLLGRLSPRLAAAALERLFTFVPDAPIRDGERDLLASGRDHSILVDRSPVTVTSWGTPGPIALLVHGWGGRGSQLGPFVRPLLDRGFRVVAYDAPAHGDSPGRFTTLPALVAALRAVARNHPPRVVVAHSFGTVAATLALADGLAAERAVFLAPVDDPWRFLDLLTADLGLTPEIAGRVRSSLEERFDLAGDDLVGSRRAPEIDIPLLAFHDEGDRQVPPEDARRLAAAWPGATLEVTDGLGHHRILGDRDVVDRATAFLAAVVEPTANSSSHPIDATIGPPPDAPTPARRPSHAVRGSLATAHDTTE